MENVLDIPLQLKDQFARFDCLRPLRTRMSIESVEIGCTMGTPLWLSGDSGTLWWRVTLCVSITPRILVAKLHAQGIEQTTKRDDGSRAQTWQ